MKKNFLFAVALLSFSAVAFAEGFQVKGVIGGGFTKGGDTIARVDYADGTNYKVDAGGMLAANLGVEVQFTERLSTQFLAGYHTDRANAIISSSNQANGVESKVIYERYPVEWLGHIRLNDWLRIGGGARYTYRPRVRPTGAIPTTVVVSESFKPMWGSVVEAEIFPLDWFGIKFRYVSEKLKSKSQPQYSDLNASHGGLYFEFYY